MSDLSAIHYLGRVDSRFTLRQRGLLHPMWRYSLLRYIHTYTVVTEHACIYTSTICECMYVGDISVSADKE